MNTIRALFPTGLASMQEAAPVFRHPDPPPLQVLLLLLLFLLSLPSSSTHFICAASYTALAFSPSFSIFPSLARLLHSQNCSDSRGLRVAHSVTIPPPQRECEKVFHTSASRTSSARDFYRPTLQQQVGSRRERLEARNSLFRIFESLTTVGRRERQCSL